MNKKTLDDLDMTIEEYFNDIIEAMASNNKQDAWSRFDELTDKQREQFFEYVDLMFYYDVDDINSEMIKLRDYFNNR